MWEAVEKGTGGAGTHHSDRIGLQMLCEAIRTNQDGPHTKIVNHRLFTYSNAHGGQILNTTKYLRQKKKGRKEGGKEGEE